MLTAIKIISKSCWLNTKTVHFLHLSQSVGRCRSLHFLISLLVICGFLDHCGRAERVGMTVQGCQGQTLNVAFFSCYLHSTDQDWLHDSKLTAWNARKCSFPGFSGRVNGIIEHLASFCHNVKNFFLIFFFKKI